MLLWRPRSDEFHTSAWRQGKRVRLTGSFGAPPPPRLSNAAGAKHSPSGNRNNSSTEGPHALRNGMLAKLTSYRDIRPSTTLLSAAVTVDVHADAPSWRARPTQIAPTRCRCLLHSGLGLRMHTAPAWEIRASPDVLKLLLARFCLSRACEEAAGWTPQLQRIAQVFPQLDSTRPPAERRSLCC